MPLHAGFDIGIKNLAFCIIDSEQWIDYLNGNSDDPGILLWKNLNLIGDFEKCTAIIKSGKKKGDPCGNKAAWKSGPEYWCGRHQKSGAKKYTAPKIKNLNMRALKKKAFIELDKIKLFDRVSHIAIETQPRVNQQMKMFAASIEAYFIIRQQIDNSAPQLRAIRNSPAKGKLTMYTGPPISCNHIKDSYERRKYLAQKHTEYFLERAPEILDRCYFPSIKRDDLADAFLHCILAIQW